MSTSAKVAWGPALLPGGGARFCLWAPDVSTLSLRTPKGDLPMQSQADGWFALETDAVPVGGAYAFVLPDGFAVPDPAARAQMGDVHGPSKLVDPQAFRFSPFKARPWSETIIYEMHVGTFTPEGTFRAAMERLPHLADLGVTAVELMPLAQFGGNRGWGYDGVLLYAPHNTYGTPDDVKAFVEAAHSHGLMVFLDVVYNHFGPDGNYLGKYASAFFDEERHTPWGAAIAFQNAAVRSFFVENPLYWLREFNLDGLRFDAIDHVRDPSPQPILNEMARRIREEFSRPIHLHTEDERNIVSLHPYVGGRPLLFTGEWNDDYHNVIHPIATGDNEGYYQDFVDRPWHKLARALAEGFVFQGEPSNSHDGEPRGVPSAGQPINAFVAFNQNHDQVGNRAFGERLIALTDKDLLTALTAMLLLSPQTPLLWMGEEWGETNPFCFFCDFKGDLADAVRKGRRNEFAKFDAFIDPEKRDDIPDPNAPETFTASQLDWTKPDSAEGAAWLSLYRHLIGRRQAVIAPRLEGIGPNAGQIVHVGEGTAEVTWRLADQSTLHMSANLTADVAGTVPQGNLVAAVAGGALVEDPRPAPFSVVVKHRSS